VPPRPSCVRVAALRDRIVRREFGARLALDDFVGAARRRACGDQMTASTDPRAFMPTPGCRSSVRARCSAATRPRSRWPRDAVRRVREGPGTRERSRATQPGGDAVFGRCVRSRWCALSQERASAYPPAATRGGVRAAARAPEPEHERGPRPPDDERKPRARTQLRARCAGSEPPARRAGSRRSAT